MLRVLGFPQSINVRKVLWTCDEIGVSYRLESEWGAARPLSDPAFLALNPKGLVPVLVDGDHVLTESNTIVRYLAASSGRTDLLPSGVVARAEVEQWLDWQATDFNAAWRAPFQHYVRRNPQAGSPEQVARGLDQWHAMMAIVEADLTDGNAYLHPSGFTLADIVIGLSVNRYLQAPIPHRAWAPTAGWP